MKIFSIYFVIFFSLIACGQNKPNANGQKSSNNANQSTTLKVTNNVFPEKEWQRIEPEKVGFSSKAIDYAKTKFEESGGVAAMIIVKGYVIADWGDTDKKIDLRSIRKSLVSALYGIHIEKGNIDINKTLGDISFNDKNRLNESELATAIKYLMTSSSGIYLSAAYEEPVHYQKPSRGAFKPGEHFQYNNWDFNALSSIFTSLTKKDVFEEFNDQIAKPLNMQNFNSTRDTYYMYQNQLSDHPAYLFWMSTKDLARFGLLYLNEGNWNGKQIIPKDWVINSTKTQMSTGDNFYYDFGYLWWTTKQKEDSESSQKPYLARGAQSQYMHIDPSLDLIIIFRDNPFGNIKVKKSIGYPLIGGVYSAMIRE